MRLRLLLIGFGTCALWIGAPAISQQEPPRSAKPTSYDYTARTQAPPRVRGKVVAAGISWNCSDTGCSTSGPWAVPGLAACQALAAQVGAIASYGHPARQLSAQDLERCNQGLKVAGGAALAGTPTVSVPAVNAAQLRQGMNLRTQKFASLQRVREQAAAEAQRRQQQESERRLANSRRGTDCDDSRREVHPGAAETCDGRDNNCDGHVDEGQTVRRYLDADGDGHGNPARALDVCPADITQAARDAETSGGGWLVEVGNDCNDADPARWRECT